MELQELEKIWRDPAVEKTIQQREVEEMLRGSSSNHISKMRTNLFRELVTVIISVFIVSVVYFSGFGGRLQEVSWIYIGLAMVFAAYYFAKNRLLKDMLNHTGNLRNHLEHRLNKLEKYTRYYLIAGSALVPVILFAFYFLLQQKTIPLQVFGFSRHTPGFIIFYSLVTIILTAALYCFNKWNIRVLYGKHIEKLKRLLTEMNDV